jgi:hypothetical protein
LFTVAQFIGGHSNVERRLTSALFSQNSGFLLIRTAEKGQPAVSGASSMFELGVTPDKEVVVDNAQVVLLGFITKSH